MPDCGTFATEITAKIGLDRLEYLTDFCNLQISRFKRWFLRVSKFKCRATKDIFCSVMGLHTRYTIWLQKCKCWRGRFLEVLGWNFVFSIVSRDSHVFGEYFQFIKTCFIQFLKGFWALALNFSSWIPFHFLDGFWANCRAIGGSRLFFKSFERKVCVFNRFGGFLGTLMRNEFLMQFLRLYGKILSRNSGNWGGLLLLFKGLGGKFVFNRFEGFSRFFKKTFFRGLQGLFSKFSKVSESLRFRDF